ncbi:MCE family protein [Amycolatopsis sp.]|uniref:MCE family protein n=1 Tax=Amycolatopsis sp. TaxID=37632 RepID=UPI002C04ED2D|nr:MCE family protein [Amycolatopsis sp.]HVV08202.1 MCE family protein [Amycolatopsis sp.]
MTLRTRSRAVLAATAAAVLTLSGCEFTGPGSWSLPFTKGGGDGSFPVTVELAQVDNLVPNSEVKVGDVTVGNVSAIEFDDWHAKVSLDLGPETDLPANATARVGQKSLLGAEYLELSAPSGEPATGRLGAGAVIPLERTGDYPSTEEFLGALSVVLNGGGLAQIKTITTEVNDVLRGRTQDARGLLSNLDTLVSQLNQQTGNITKALNGLHDFGDALARQNDSLAKALDQLPAGVQVLNSERANLTSTLTALSDLSGVGTRVINGTRDDLLANLRSLQPVLGRLSDSGTNLVDSLSLVGNFPWPGRTVANAVRGDYANIDVTLDLTLPTLQKNFLTGLPILGALPPLGQGNTPAPPPAGLPPGTAPAPATTQPNAVLPLPGGTSSAQPAPASSQDDGVPSLLGSLLGGGR